VIDRHPYESREDTVTVLARAQQYFIFALSCWQVFARLKKTLIVIGWSPWTPRPFESIFMGAIPVLLSENLLLPFTKYINFTEFSISLVPTRKTELETTLLRALRDRGRIRQLRGAGSRVWRAFMWPDAIEPTNRLEGWTAFEWLILEISDKLRSMNFAAQ
jgi:hypothetical protein